MKPDEFDGRLPLTADACKKWHEDELLEGIIAPDVHGSRRTCRRMVRIARMLPMLRASAHAPSGRSRPEAVHDDGDPASRDETAVASATFDAAPFESSRCGRSAARQRRRVARNPTVGPGRLGGRRLLTAMPMQAHPVEVRDRLGLLSEGWKAMFLDFSEAADGRPVAVDSGAVSGRHHRRRARRHRRRPKCGRRRARRRCGVARAPASIIGSRRKVNATVDFSAVLAGEVSRQSRSVQNRHRTSREIRHELAGWMGGIRAAPIHLVIYFQ